jgi:hypothetical protein
VTQSQVWSALKAIAFAIAGALLLTSPTYAASVTLNFAGIADSSALGGLADAPYSGFFTWDSASAPTGVDGTSLAEYDTMAYQLIFDGIDLTKPVGSKGSGLFVFNDLDFFEPGVFVDGLAMLAIIDDSTPITRLFIAALTGPTTTWNTLALPSDLNFLSSLTNRLAFFSDEVPFEGDENDIFLGTGTLTITGQSVTPAPEPATLTLTALGIGGLIGRVRRSRRSK